MTGRVIVVGSVNEDLVATVNHLPAPGETVTGARFAQHHGGKGGNQAVAAARLGAVTIFVGAVGADDIGTAARAALEADGVDVTELRTLPDQSTGVALILVDAIGFVGKEAYLRQREGSPAAVLSSLTVDDPRSGDGTARYMLGREPILAADGSPLVDAKKRRSYVTSAGSGPSIGKHILMAYLPPEQAVEGTKLLVEYFGERYPVTVAVAGSTPLFDPGNERIRS